jgi:hypothetical protein
MLCDLIKTKTLMTPIAWQQSKYARMFLLYGLRNKVKTRSRRTKLFGYSKAVPSHAMEVLGEGEEV